MNRVDIMAIWRRVSPHTIMTEDGMKVCEAIAAAEREACAQVAEGFPHNRDWVPGSLYGNLRNETAAAIRDRAPDQGTGDQGGAA